MSIHTYIHTHTHIYIYIDIHFHPLSIQLRWKVQILFSPFFLLYFTFPFIIEVSCSSCPASRVQFKKKRPYFFYRQSFSLLSHFSFFSSRVSNGKWIFIPFFFSSFFVGFNDYQHLSQTFGSFINTSRITYS